MYLSLRHKRVKLRIKEAKLRKSFLLLFLVVLTACSGASNKSEDQSFTVKETIQTYLSESKGIEVKNVTLEVGNIKSEGNKLTCDATVALKENPNQKMTFQYSLIKENGRWKVASSESVGSPHAGKPMPSGHPPTGEGQQMNQDLPPPLPPGHPPIKEKK
jgi:hypothetical protein